MPNQYRFVESWTEDDLRLLPSDETDLYEYKSSITPDEKLKEKLAIAASAFWNSGGGIFIVGINNTGQIDGGISQTVRRQKRRDWVDQILASIEPLGPYTVRTIEKTTSDSAIRDQHIVLVVAFGASDNAPHMAPDKKYYVRAGAHSAPASHFLVEAIRARRGFQSPTLRAIFQLHPQKAKVVQLAIVCINQATALNVKIDFVPLPQGLVPVAKQLPLTVAVIDKEHPFEMDICTVPDSSIIFGDVPVELRLEFSDIVGRTHHYCQEIDPRRNFAPTRLEVSNSKDLDKTMITISRQIERLIHVLEASARNDQELG